MSETQAIGLFPRISYMTGCVIGVLAALAHTAAEFQEQAPGSEQERLMLDAMVTVKIDALHKMGVERTMMEIANGFSWHWTWSVGACALACLAVRFWRKGDCGLMRFAALCATGFFLVSLAISLKHFFFIPNGFLGACAVCFGLAAATARPKAATL